jgi:hypothetical protein
VTGQDSVRNGSINPELDPEGEDCGDFPDITLAARIQSRVPPCRTPSAPVSQDGSETNDPALTAAVKFSADEGLRLVSPRQIEDVMIIPEDAPRWFESSSLLPDEIDEEVIATQDSHTSIKDTTISIKAASNSISRHQAHATSSTNGISTSHHDVEKPASQAQHSWVDPRHDWANVDDDVMCSMKVAHTPTSAQFSCTESWKAIVLSEAHGQVLTQSASDNTVVASNDDNLSATDAHIEGIVEPLDDETRIQLHGSHLELLSSLKIRWH